MDSIERAYRKKLKLAELYGVSVTAIVWMGGNRFVIVREGAKQRDTEVIYANVGGIKMTIQELLRLSKTTPKHIRVHYDNGDSIETKINATVPEIVSYYLDKKQSFSYGDGPETMATARCVEFVGGIMCYNKWTNKNEELSRVYSISDKFMKRHDLYNKFRCTVKVWDSWGPWYRKEDYAYIGQMFE